MKAGIVIFLLISVHFSYGQVSWKQRIIKTRNGNFQLHLTAVLEAPWHIYSQNLKPGGPIATKISYSKDPDIAFIGKAVEKGKLITRHETAFDMDVNYFEEEVDFVQEIKVSNSQRKRLIGQIEFMLCSNNQCLPPTLKSFSLELP